MLAAFISKLPAALEPDQPVPDIDYLVDILLSSNLTLAADDEGEDDAEKQANSGAGKGVKHERANGAFAASTDIFQSRQQRMRVA